MHYALLCSALHQGGGRQRWAALGTREQCLAIVTLRGALPSFLATIIVVIVVIIIIVIIITNGFSDNG